MQYIFFLNNSKVYKLVKSGLGVIIVKSWLSVSCMSPR